MYKFMIHQTRQINLNDTKYVPLATVTGTVFIDEQVIDQVMITHIIYGQDDTHIYSANIKLNVLPDQNKFAVQVSVLRMRVERYDEEEDSLEVLGAPAIRIVDVDTVAFLGTEFGNLKMFSLKHLK